jgi:hypothetical protein
MHFRLILLKLGILIGLALLSSFSLVVEPDVRNTGLAVVVSLLLLGIVLELVISQRRYDRRWFVSRSIAESVKIQAWFYMMNVPPYGEKDADDRFIDTLQQIKDQNKDIPLEVLTLDSNGPQITPRMKEVRSWPIDERRNFYFQNRIKDQVQWYAAKSKWNSTRENAWNTISIVFQVLAAVIAVALIAYDNSPLTLPNGTDFLLDPIGVLTTVSAAALSWGEARRFGELAKSYGLIAGELSILQERSHMADDENSLSSLVVDVERTISREHALWIIRRSEGFPGPKHLL